MHRFDLHVPFTAQTATSQPQLLQMERADSLKKGQGWHQLTHPLNIYPQEVGKTQLTFRLFGILPIRRSEVNVLPNIRVIPGGQSIGVKLKSNGVIVVGRYPNPQENGVRVGDYIIRINEKEIHHLQDVADFVEQAGKQHQKLRLDVLRDGKKHNITLRPFFDTKEQAYRIGLYIRDSAAGVGTLTFFDPQSKRYGALGHMISDVDTGQAIRVGEGKVVHSNVTSIQKGASGEPGEKRAIFLNEDKVLGNIKKNSPFGVFGQMNHVPAKDIYKQPLPVALAEQVKEGPAKILTVVEGQKVEEYNIRIMHVMKQKYPATKGMIIKVTDPRLLNKTGGIVQGMSGSPIIQDGKIIGAVTHVFVNNPTSGYGTFIEWMLRDAGVIKQTSGSESFGTASFYHLIISRYGV